MDRLPSCQCSFLTYRKRRSPYTGRGFSQRVVPESVSLWSSKLRRNVLGPGPFSIRATFAATRHVSTKGRLVQYFWLMLMGLAPPCSAGYVVPLVKHISRCPIWNDERTLLTIGGVTGKKSWPPRGGKPVVPQASSGSSWFEPPEQCQICHCSAVQNTANP